MDFSQLEMLLFGEDGACISECNEICVEKLEEAYEALEKIDSRLFDMNDHVQFSNVFVRYTLCSAGFFGNVKEYFEVLSKMYELFLNSPFYVERDIENE